MLKNTIMELNLIVHFVCLVLIHFVAVVVVSEINLFDLIFDFNILSNYKNF